MKVAIASGKGGTGKTTLATNLAKHMAETSPVILADLDVEEPNSGLFLTGKLHHQEPKYKMVPSWEKETCSLSGSCQAVCNFNAILKMGNRIMVFPELCHGCYACSELCPTASLPMQAKRMGDLKHIKTGNLDFVESRLMISEEQAVPLIRQTIDYVDEKFSAEMIKIFDAPPGTSCPVIEVIRSADLVILVTEPTPFGLHDLKLAVETVRYLGKEFVIVLNRYGIGDDRVERYCETQNIPLTTRISNNRSIAEAYAKGELCYREIPEMATAVETITQLIYSRNGGGYS